MLIQGFALGQHVYASSTSFTLTSFKVNGTTYSNTGNIFYTDPVLVNETEFEGYVNYLWKTSIQVNIKTPDNFANYMNTYNTIKLVMNYPSNCSLVSYQIDNVYSQNELNATMYGSSISMSSYNINAWFRSAKNNIFINNSTLSAYNILTFDMLITTHENVVPRLSFPTIEVNAQFWETEYNKQVILDAINESTSAEDLASILDIMEVDTQTLASILQQLGSTNTHLTYIQEYAYEIWDILARRYPTEASQNLEDAESDLSDINDDIQQYTPPTVDANDINTKANNAFQTMNIEGDSNNLFFYLNWSSVLPILTLIFTLAILSYVLFGGK